MNIFSAFDFLSDGGWVAWVLAILSAVLWYAIGYRYLYLNSKSLDRSPESLLHSKQLDSTDLAEGFAEKIKFHLEHVQSNLETALQMEYQSFIQVISVHRQTIRGIVIVAPLLGLLGTVIGMIETFESLQDSALFSQSGGIAGGISQALITTQMGLVVAIPGLLIGKKLDRKEEALCDYAERMIYAVNLKEESS